MKGTLHKAESGWQVWYQNREDLFYEGTLVKILPLHPDEPMLVDKRWENTEVEFEIVANEGEPLGRGEQPYKQYAKLIDDDLSDWDVTLTDGLEEEEWDTKQAQSPKYKAEDLFVTYYQRFPDSIYSNEGAKAEAKWFASNTVDEIINTLNRDIRDLDVRGNILLDLIEYWREVKQEIDKL